MLALSRWWVAAAAARAPRARAWLSAAVDQCTGCGARLQVADPAAPGYVPPNKLVAWSKAPAQARERLASLVAKVSSAEPLGAQEARATDDAASPLVDQRAIDEAVGLALAPRSALQEMDPSLITEDTAVVDAADLKRARRELRAAAPRITCQRCYHLSTYREVLSVSVTARDYEQVLKQIRERPALVVLVVDLVDFPGSLLRQLAATVGKHEVILVGNKVDLLPPDARRAGLRHWLDGEAARLLDTRISNVHLVSSHTGEGVDDLLKDMRESRGTRPIYIVGCANVGKSALVNQILRRDGRGARTLTTSTVPGTTLNLIRFTLRDGAVVHDTPGLVPDHPLLHKYMTHEEMRLLTPTKPFQAPMFALTPGRSLLLGGLGRIDHVGPAPSVLLTVFMAPRVSLHVTRTDTVDYFVRKHLSGPLLQPPLPRDQFGSAETGEAPIKLPPLPPPEMLDITADIVSPAGLSGRSRQAALDIVFPGAGFVSVTVPAPATSSTALRAFYPSGLGLMTRRPMLPYEAQKRGPRERGGLRARVHYRT